MKIFSFISGYLHLGTLETLIMIILKTQRWWSFFVAPQLKPTGDYCMMMIGDFFFRTEEYRIYSADILGEPKVG